MAFARKLEKHNLSVILWDANVPNQENKKSILVYNCTLTLRSEIGTLVFHFPVRKFMEGEYAGDLTIGSSSKLRGMRDVIEVFDKEKQVKRTHMSMNNKLWASIKDAVTECSKTDVVEIIKKELPSAAASEAPTPVMNDEQFDESGIPTDETLSAAASEVSESEYESEIPVATADDEEAFI